MSFLAKVGNHDPVVLTAFDNSASRTRSVACNNGAGHVIEASLANGAPWSSIMVWRRRSVSASETGLLKSSQNAWSPSAFQNKLSKQLQNYNIVTQHQSWSYKTKRNQTKLKTPHHFQQFNDELARFETIDTKIKSVTILRVVQYCINIFKRMYKNCK